MRLESALATLDHLIAERTDAIKRLDFAREVRWRAYQRDVPKSLRDGWRGSETEEEKRLIAEYEAARREHETMYAAIQQEIWALAASKQALVTEDHLHKALHPIHR